MESPIYLPGLELGMKAVIPAAGLGTRMLPVTKAQPKEMLPLLDKPIIQYVIEEAAASGCDNVLLITGRSKRALEDHFDSNLELEHFLEERDNVAALELVRNTHANAEIHFVRQPVPRGLGDAILRARHFIADEAFAVLLGDDVVIGEPPATRYLRDIQARVRHTVIGIEEVPADRTHAYGIVETEGEGQIRRVTGLVEKPAPGTARSNHAMMGRYILTPTIFEHLIAAGVDQTRELQLTTALRSLLQQEEITAVLVPNLRMDTGNLAGWLNANLTMARQDPELWAKVQAHFRTLPE